MFIAPRLFDPIIKLNDVVKEEEKYEEKEDIMARYVERIMVRYVKKSFKMDMK